MGDYDLLVDHGGERRLIWPDWRKIRFSEKQADYLYSDNRLEIIMAGRGFGKDHLALWKKILRGNAGYWARRDGRDSKFRRPGLKWHLGIFAGQADNYEDNINKLFSILPRVPGKGVGGKPNFHWNSTDQRFELYGDRQLWISCYTLHGNGQKRGPGFDDVLVTEAQGVTKNKFMSVVNPMIVRGGYTPNVTLVGTGDCGWFDSAYEDATENNYDAFFGNYVAFSGTSFDNPETDCLTASLALREFSENPSRFQIERLGLPNITLMPDEKPELIFHKGLVDCALTMDRLTLPVAPLLVIDLIYGGTDKLCLGVWNKNENTLLWPEFYTADELKLNVNNPYGTLAEFFMKQSQRFPGCTIAYDCQGQMGGSLQAHVPRHINIIPMRRSREQKNTMVESVIERMGLLDAQGRSIGLRMPHPDNKFLSARQRTDMVKFLEDTYNYRRVTDPKDPRKYWYTKGVGYEDDGPDMLSWTTSQLRPLNRTQPNIKESGRAARRGLFS